MIVKITLHEFPEQSPQWIRYTLYNVESLKHFSEIVVVTFSDGKKESQFTPWQIKSIEVKLHE